MTVAAISAGSTGAAEPIEPGWHTVRPGETLEAITRRYLGSEERWRENWRLNPSVEDPHLLLPGQRILVYQAVEATVPTARLTSLSGRVERRPLPIPWDPAREGDLLLERDGIRTQANASTELRFVDGTSVVLSEESLIFLRRTGSSLREAERKEVEIVEGQADIATHAGELPVAGVEIVVGGAQATTRLDERGVAQTRARRSGAGAQVMIYEGSGEVTSAGARVALPRGTGSAVAEGAAPSPPEELLAAPQPARPAAGTRLDYPDPTFVWDGVAGAASYTVEVCRDPACAELVRRRGRSANALESEPLPVGELYWRVTAVSASGLDGYPSASVPFEVVSDRQDVEPPTGRIAIYGPSVETPAGRYWGPAARLDVQLEDARSGVGSWTATVDGREVDEGALLGPWASGDHTIAVTALDAAGNRAELEPVVLRVDGESPVIRILVGGADLVEHLIGRGGGRPGVVRGLPHCVAETRIAAGAPLPWRVLAWGDETEPLAANYLPRVWPWEFRRGHELVALKGRRPQLLLSAPGLEVPWRGSTRTLDADEVLWIEAMDEHVGLVDRFAVRADGDRALIVELTDAVGSRGRIRWPFAR